MSTYQLIQFGFALTIAGIAAVTDFRTRRIPNWLTFGGLGLALLVAGIGVARHARWAGPLYLVSLGAFAYTGVVSPGYFAQNGEWPFVVMFAAFLLAAVPAALGVLRQGSAVTTSR